MIDDLFLEENRIPIKTKEISSPRGSYNLFIDYYRTNDPCRNYARSRVYHFNGWNPIIDIKRSDDIFPFAWVEHHNEDCYFYCSGNYQGHTIINLGTR